MENICDLMSVVIFIILLSCVLLLVLTLLSLDQLTVVDFNLLYSLHSLLHYLLICYVYCHFSEIITAKSFEICYVVYSSLWYEMSVEQQKAIILIIQRSQKEFRLTGLGLVDCSLTTFTSVTIHFYTSHFLSKLNNN